MNTATIIPESKIRLNIVTSAPAPKPQATQSPVLTLDKAQCALFAQLIAARKACNAADATKREIERALDLPRYEGKAQSVQVLNPKGKAIGQIQVAFRAGYSVDPGWINKLVSV